MKKVLLSAMVLIAMTSAASATTIYESTNCNSIEVLKGYSWSYTVKDKDGTFLEGGIFNYQGSGTLGDAIIAFGEFVKKLEAQYPGAVISFEFI